MKRKTIFCSLALFLLYMTNIGYPAADEDDVFVRVIDVGAGLCCVVKMPDNHYMIYDAGNYVGGGREAFESIAEVIPEGSTVDLMVLSHSDSDHLGAVDEICQAYTVKRILRSGFQRSSQTWQAADSTIQLEKALDNAIDINLRYFEYPAGATYRFGEVFVTMVAGWHKPPAAWGLSSSSGEYRNAGSIVMRLYYKEKAILFCGDTVGRHIGDSPNVCIAAEKHMVDNSPVIDIKSDVMIAGHHGADNASSTLFIKTVQPSYVIFSAGHKYQHPRAATAKRYLDFNSQIKTFRTDRGDDEGSKEWNGERIPNHKDPIGDDDVDIVIKSDGTVLVKYKSST